MNGLIPVTIVTGFLGSGKTTLLSSLIKSRQSRRLALLINEFGEVSIDGALIRDCADGHEQIRIHDFPYGLIAYGDDELFIPTMRAIAERRANVDHVLIETSGLALPTAIMELLQGPELAGDFILDATLAVVDTPLLLSDQFERSADADSADANSAVANSVASLFDQQLEFADVVVLNKIDALDEAALLLAETGCGNARRTCASWSSHTTRGSISGWRSGCGCTSRRWSRTRLIRRSPRCRARSHRCWRTRAA